MLMSFCFVFFASGVKITWPVFATDALWPPEEEIAAVPQAAKCLGLPLNLLWTTWKYLSKQRCLFCSAGSAKDEENDLWTANWQSFWAVKGKCFSGYDAAIVWAMHSVQEFNFPTMPCIWGHRTENRLCSQSPFACIPPSLFPFLCFHFWHKQYRRDGEPAAHQLQPAWPIVGGDGRCRPVIYGGPHCIIL